MAAGTHGNWAGVWVNGYDLATQHDQVQYAHTIKSNPVLWQNVGIRQATPGVQAPTAQLAGMALRGPNLLTAYNLFSAAQGPGSLGDVAFNIGLDFGFLASPALADYGAILCGTLLPEFQRSQDKGGIQKYSAQFRTRGIRVPCFPVLVNPPTTQKGSLTTNYVDDGLEGVGTLNGGLALFEVLTPTGTAASGSLGIGANAATTDTFVLGGVTYTVKTALTPTAGEFLLGVSAIDTMQNLWYALVGDPAMAGTKYAVGTPPLVSTVIPGPFNALTGSIPLTWYQTGVAGNSYALVKTGTAFTVSASTLLGGVAGETATLLAVEHCTTSGGAYTAIATSTLDMTKRSSELIAVPIGTTINRYLKLVVTMSASTMNWCAAVLFGRFFPNQA